MVPRLFIIPATSRRSFSFYNTYKLTRGPHHAYIDPTKRHCKISKCKRAHLRLWNNNKKNNMIWCALIKGTYKMFCIWTDLFLAALHRRRRKKLMKYMAHMEHTQPACKILLNSIEICHIECLYNFAGDTPRWKLWPSCTWKQPKFDQQPGVINKCVISAPSRIRNGIILALRQKLIH